MKKTIFTLSILFSSIVFAQTPVAPTVEEAKDIILHRNCRKAENKPCIALDFTSLNKDIIFEEKSSGADTEYTLKIFGKLNRGIEKEQIVKFIASKGACTSFGKGTVAVLGFSSAGNPILLTEEGSLEVTSKLLSVGANNLQVVNTTSLEREGFLSRSINTDGYAISRIHFDARGSVYLLDGTECFELRKKELLRKVDIKRCESKKTEVKDLSTLGKIKLKENQKAYQIKDSTNILIIDSGTCS